MRLPLLLPFDRDEDADALDGRRRGLRRLVWTGKLTDSAPADAANQAVMRFCCALAMCTSRDTCACSRLRWSSAPASESESPSAAPPTWGFTIFLRTTGVGDGSGDLMSIRFSGLYFGIIVCCPQDGEDGGCCCAGGCGPPKMRPMYRPPLEELLLLLSELTTEEASSSSLLVLSMLRGVGILTISTLSLTTSARL